MGFLNKEGLKYLWETYIEKALDKKVDKVTGKGLSTNDYTTEEKTKLANISAGAEANQNAFSNVKVGDVTIGAGNKTDTISFIPGNNNVTITPNTDANSVTITTKDTVYTHPDTSGNKHIPSGGSEGNILKWSADGTAEWGDGTAYSNGDGIAIENNTITNTGVRSIGTGDTNGTISVNTNGTSTEVAVKGLGSAAYTESSAYATADQGTKADNAMPKSGGAFTGDITLKADPTENLHPVTKQYLDSEILELTEALSQKADKDIATETTAGLMSADDKVKVNAAMPKSGGEFTGDVIFSVGGKKVWISYTDEAGNPTTIPYLHWIEE